LEQKSNKRDLKVCCVYILMTEYIFYKISCIDKNIDYSYIGSTKNFRRRKCEHKNVCTNEASKKYNYQLYQTIRENGGFDNWTMSPIGKGIFENRLDALIEEQNYINYNNTTLNTNRTFNTIEDYHNYHKQYRYDNYEHIKESNKLYYETHKDEIKELNKKYRETHREEISEKKKIYNETHKEEISEKKKKYRETHKDEIKELNKKYREAHKEKIKARSAEKTTCECGGCYTYAHKAEHFKSKRHIAYFS